MLRIFVFGLGFVKKPTLVNENRAFCQAKIDVTRTSVRPERSSVIDFLSAIST